MRQVPIDKIRNVCLLGHGGSGKTSLTEAMLKFAGVTDRLGKVSDGTTVTDFDPEEIKRTISINTAIASFEWGSSKYNIIDTPGYFDFVGEILEGVRVADAAIIVLSGKSGLSVGAEKSWDYCEARKLPRMFFVNKIDDERADFKNVLEEIKAKFGKALAPFQVPIVKDDKVVGFVDIIEMKAKLFQNGSLAEADIPGEMSDEVGSIREMIVEAVAETDENLMERYFGGEEFTTDEIRAALRQGVKSGDIVPVLCGSAIDNKGIGVLLDAIGEYLPSPADMPGEKTASGELKADASASLAAMVFKTVADPYVGKLSYFRVYQGELKPDMTVTNSRTGNTEKIGKIYYVLGKKQIETDRVIAGDIAAVTKLSATVTGDTLCKQGSNIAIEGIKFPEPNLTLAITPKAKGDEEKISSGLQRLVEEDPTFKVYNNLETHQMLISGLGELHLDVITSKLKSKFGVAVDLIEPKVPYRETIRKKVRVEGKHKKQSGGHGQYGHVWIEFEPGEEEGLTFEEKIFGGAVPKNYFPAVEKGLQESILHGVLAGYPVVNLKATLVDGSYHPVDSSEMAFKIAASLAYKKGMEEASPVLLEPIGHLEVTVPSANMGDIIGDINKRRGRVLGMNPIGGGMEQVVAEVPMAEVHKYATDLRSMTQARGSFTLEFERYEEAPPNVAQKVIEESKKEKE
ncbi:MAG: Elongation factor G [Firmicutes bacterium ADurb.Bin193]|nr:MAG: Elongation factor G [Firmicutes bacterium ADurb.Bin193]